MNAEIDGQFLFHLLIWLSRDMEFMCPVGRSPRLFKKTWFQTFHPIMPRQLCIRHTENFSMKLVKEKAGHGAKFAQMQLYVSSKPTPRHR